MRSHSTNPYLEQLIRPPHASKTRASLTSPVTYRLARVSFFLSFLFPRLTGESLKLKARFGRSSLYPPPWSERPNIRFRLSSSISPSLFPIPDWLNSDPNLSQINPFFNRIVPHFRSFLQSIRWSN